MINVKKEVFQALGDNQVLVSLLGGEKRIYQLVAPDGAKFPRIVFSEISNFDSEYADNKPIASDLLYQVSIFHTSPISAELASVVDSTMKGIGFARISGADLFEDDTRVYHKALRYKITRNILEV